MIFQAVEERPHPSPPLALSHQQARGKRPLPLPRKPLQTSNLKKLSAVPQVRPLHSLNSALRLLHEQSQYLRRKPNLQPLQRSSGQTISQANKSVQPQEVTSQARQQRRRKFLLRLARSHRCLVSHLGRKPVEQLQ